MNLVANGPNLQELEISNIQNFGTANYVEVEKYEFGETGVSSFETFVTSGGNVGGFLTIVPLTDFTVKYFGPDNQGRLELKSQFTYDVLLQNQLALLNIVPEPSSCALAAMALSVGCLRRRRQA